MSAPAGERVAQLRREELGDPAGCVPARDVREVRFADVFDAFAEEVRWLMPFDRAVMFRLDSIAGIVEPYAACPSEGFVP